MKECQACTCQIKSDAERFSNYWDKGKGRKTQSWPWMKTCQDQIGQQIVIRDSFPITDKPGEQMTQKHLDRIESAQILMDTWMERKTWRSQHYFQKMAKFTKKTLEDKKRFYGINSDEAYTPKYISDDGKEVNMKKGSAKLETILKEQCLVYNEESERPKVIIYGVIVWARAR